MTKGRHASGVWERWQRPAGAQGGPPAGVVIPGRILAPPFKPEVKAAYDIAQKASREADLRGEPVSINTVSCLPEGMPAMMNGINPMEILETPGQVTIIQESENQVRRIYLDEQQGTPGDVVSHGLVRPFGGALGGPDPSGRHHRG